MTTDPDVALANRLSATPSDVPTAQLLAASPPSSGPRVVALLLQQAAEQTRRDPRQSLHLAQRALEVSNDSAESDLATQAACQRALGHAYRALGHYAQSLDFYEHAARIYRRSRLPVEAARTHLGSIDALMYLGRGADALALGRRLRRTFAHYDETLNAAKLEANLSIIQARLHRPRRALALADAAAATFTALGEDALLAQINVNRANILTDIGAFRAALEAFTAARAVFAAHDMRSWTAKIDVNMGCLYAAQGHYSQALNIISAACRVFAALQSPKDMATAHLDLAEVYLSLNLDAEAEKIAAEAVAIFEAEGIAHDMARALLLQARAIAATHGDQYAALTLLERAAVMFSAENYIVGVCIARLHQGALLLGSDPATALLRAREAETVLARENLVAQFGQSLLLTAMAHERLGARRAARVAFKRAERLGTRYGLPWLLAQAHHGQGRLSERRDPGAAREAYEAAIEAIENMRTELQHDQARISFVRGRLGPYEDLLRLLLRQDVTHHRQAAFMVVEKARSRALLDMLAGNLDVAGGEGTAGADPAFAEVHARIRQLREELNWRLSAVHDWGDDAHQQRSRLARRDEIQNTRAIEDELRDLIRHWHALDPAGATLRSASVFDVATVQAHLAPRQALVEYMIIDDEILAFVVDRDSVSLARHLASAAEVGQLIARLHAGLQRFSYGETWAAQYATALQKTTERHLARLGEALLGPLAASLAAYDQLIIAPHGPLHYVPFHALRLASGELLDTHETVVAPSASVWVICQRRVRRAAPPSRPSAVVLGVEDSHTPWMAHEAQTVGRLLSGARVFTGSDATLATVYREGPTCDLLHLACHGLFRSDEPLFSAIKLADGWLTTHDIYNLRLRARLVTLSGCQTGQQSIGPGDDLVGLARGFFLAGASQLVVSLWMVNDASTRLFMEYFYTALIQGQSAGAALRVAQRLLRDRLAHPYYWAPFMVIGAS